MFLAFKLSVSVALTALPSLSGLSLLTQCLSWRSGFFLTPLLNNIPLHNVLKISIFMPISELAKTELKTCLDNSNPMFAHAWL